jgi:hypothetical protein
MPPQFIPYNIYHSFSLKNMECSLLESRWLRQKNNVIRRNLFTVTVKHTEILTGRFGAYSDKTKPVHVKLVFRRVQQHCENWLLASSRLSACNNSAPTGWIFMKFRICVFFKTLPRKIKFNQNRTRRTSTLHEVSFMTLPRGIILIMRNVLHRNSTEI